MVVVEEVKLLAEKVKVRYRMSGRLKICCANRAPFLLFLSLTNGCALFFLFLVSHGRAGAPFSDQECYKKEGVNHYRSCEELARAYVRRVSSPNLKGDPVELKEADE